MTIHPHPVHHCLYRSGSFHWLLPSLLTSCILGPYTRIPWHLSPSHRVAPMSLDRATASPSVSLAVATTSLPVCINNCVAQSLLRHRPHMVFVMFKTSSLTSSRSASIVLFVWTARLRVVGVHSHIASLSSNTTPLLVGGPLPCKSNIGNTEACFRPRCIAGSSKPSPCPGSSDLITSTLPSLSTLIASLPFFYNHDGPDCVDLAITPPTTTVSTRIQHHHGPSAFVASSATTLTSVTSTAQHHTQLPQHQHKGLPPCMSVHWLLQPQLM